MALVVNTNLQSMQGQRALAQTSHSLQGTFERLSTGLRINRAADDAAGLGVSENLDSELRASRQAIRNTNDGISLTQVAEGAATEVSNMLKRMKELLVQASSETLGSAERAYISEEVYTLRQEIDRVALSTEWQGTKLISNPEVIGTSTVGLNVGTQFGPSSIVYNNGVGFWGGGYSDSSHPTFSMGSATVSGFADVNGPPLGAALGVYTLTANTGTDTLTLTDPNSVAATANVSNFDSYMDGGEQKVRVEFSNGMVLQLAGTGGTFTMDDLTTAVNGNASLQSFTFANMDFRNTVTSSTISAVTGTYTFSTDLSGEDPFLTLTGPGGSQTLNIASEADYSTGDHGVFEPGSTATYNFNELGISISFDPGGSFGLTTFSAALLGGYFGTPASFQVTDSSGAVADTGIDLQVGANNGQKIVLQTTNLTADGLGLTAITSDSAISSAQVARNQLSVIDTALNSVGAFRSQLGAQQNRLESAQRNLTTYTENISAAKSRILDADFAYETAQLAKFQILQQSGVAVLGQANQASQAALRLLQ